MKLNYHTHTTGSDGKTKPEAWIKLAIRKKFDVLGITDHYHFPVGFRKPSNEMYSYYSNKHYLELLRLKKKYKGEINVLVNVEFDWLEDYKKWLEKEANKRKYDLKYISVHYIKTKKEHIPLDWTEEGFCEMIKSFGNVRKLIEWYYSSLRKAISLDCFDVVSHFDLIKIWNKDSKYFSDEEDWYKREVLKTLKLIKKMGMRIDLNSSGLRKPCRERYPSEWIVEKCKKLNIELLIGTDAHCEEEIEAGLNQISYLI